MGLGEGTLILSDIRRLGPFLGVQILNFWGEGGSERCFFFFFFWGGGGWDMMTLWAFFLGGGHRKTGLFLGVISKFKV